MRAYRSATITFGLVTVPVSLGTVFEDAKVSGRFVCDEHHVPMRQSYECPVDGVGIKTTGYELSDGSFRVFDPEELRDLEAVKSKAIDLTGFVDVAEIDPMYFDKAYVLWPKEKEAATAYGLLQALFKGMDVAGVGTVTLEKSSVPAAIRYSERIDRLMLHTLKYEAQLKDLSSLDPVQDNIDPKYVAAGQGLITAAMIPFDLSGHVDTYQEGLKVMILEANKELTAQKTPKRVAKKKPVAQAETPDKMMEALKASVEAMKEEKQ